MEKYYAIAAFSLVFLSGAIALGFLASSACNSIGRNPSAAGEIRFTALLLATFIELVVLLAFVVCILMLIMKQ